MKNTRGRHLSSMHRSMEQTRGAVGTHKSQAVRKIVPKGDNPVANILSHDGGSMQVGLVVPGMQKEHGLPLGWTPFDKVAAENKPDRINSGNQNTGLVLDTMYRESGLPSGFSAEVNNSTKPALSQVGQAMAGT